MDCADTWRRFLAYEGRLPVRPESGPSAGVSDPGRATGAIAESRRELTARDEASSPVGSPRGGALAAIPGNIEENMSGESRYRTCAEKAAHLRCFVLKDHPLGDGNRRICSLLCLLYLRQGVDHPRKLPALILRTAASAPVGRDCMIRLIVDLPAGAPG